MNDILINNLTLAFVMFLLLFYLVIPAVMGQDKENTTRDDPSPSDGMGGMNYFIYNDYVLMSVYITITPPK